MQLSIVTSLYKSQDTILEFYQKIKSIAEEVTQHFEIVFVDDGSPDASAQIVKTLLKDDPRIVLVELSRNFGHHQAIMAGISAACGERVFLIDCDLEEQPELLKTFWAEMDGGHYDVVYGVQAIRKGNLRKKVCGSLFYQLFNFVSDTTIPENPCTVRLMNKNYVDALLSIRDKNLFLAGSFSWAGFSQLAVAIDKDQKKETTYNIVRSLELLINAITSFSSYPLKLVFLVGAILSCGSALIGLYLLIYKVMYAEQVLLGYTSIILSIWFLGGLIILFIGILGLYLGKVFVEVKDRPLYIIRAVYRRNS